MHKSNKATIFVIRWRKSQSESNIFLIFHPQKSHITISIADDVIKPPQTYYYIANNDAGRNMLHWSLCSSHQNALCCICTWCYLLSAVFGMIYELADRALNWPILYETYYINWMDVGRLKFSNCNELIEIRLVPIYIYIWGVGGGWFCRGQELRNIIWSCLLTANRGRTRQTLVI